MADYISRDDVIKKIAEVQDKATSGTEDVTYFRAIKIIRDMPASDVQPVVHGRWLSHHAIWIDQPKIEGWFVQAKCSECEMWAHVMNPYTKDVDYKQCPHCGAKMDIIYEDDKIRAIKVTGWDNDARNLTDEETEIYNSWIDSEAENTGENILDGEQNEDT